MSLTFFFDNVTRDASTRRGVAGEVQSSKLKTRIETTDLAWIMCQKSD